MIKEPTDTEDAKRLVVLFEELGNAKLIEHADPQVLEEGKQNLTRMTQVVKDKKYERVQGIGDDFIPDTRLYNALGALYPNLSREERDLALRVMITQFDGVNYVRVQQNHTSRIGEPLLLADIAIVRGGFYWPGTNEGHQRISELDGFGEFSEKYIREDGLFIPGSVNSEFSVGFAALNEFGQEFADKCHEGFLERVVQGMAWFWLGNVPDESKFKRLDKHLPESLHKKARDLYKEGGYANRDQFQN